VGQKRPRRIEDRARKNREKDKENGRNLQPYPHYWRGEEPNKLNAILPPSDEQRNR
jgi:hypothetical protein